MRRLIRGLFKLAFLAGLGYAVYRLIAEEPAPRVEPSAPPPPPPPTAPRAKVRTSPHDTRPPSGPTQPSPGTVRSIGVGEVPEHVPKWVEPNGTGACPPTHPVKAKLDSGIFHVPGGRYYDRVTPDRCYRDAEAAGADGLRPSKQ